MIPAFGALYDFVRPGNKMTIAEFINSLREDHPVHKSEDIMSFLTLWKESATEGPLKSELRGCTGVE